MESDDDGDGRDTGADSGPEYPSFKYVLSLSVVGGLALGTLAIHLWNLRTAAGEPFELALGVLPALGLSLALFGVVVWIHSRELERLALSIGRWSLAGAIVLVVVSLHSILYQQTNGVLIRDPSFVIANHATVGAIIGTVLGVYDGQRRTSTADLRAERERARRLSDRLSVLNRVLRHDIRNAVNVIQGNTELARTGSREMETLVDTIDRKAGELAALSERARDLEQLLERETLERRPVELGAVLQAKVHRLQNEYPDLEIRMDVPRDLTVIAAELFEDALDELLENAVEHNDAADPTLSVSATREGEHVVVQIEDNGPGIPDSELRAIDRGRETDLGHASGLGLWFVRWVVELSDGEFTIHDGESTGTVAAISLPAATA